MDSVVDFLFNLNVLYVLFVSGEEFSALSISGEDSGGGDSWVEDSGMDSGEDSGEDSSVEGWIMW